MPCPILTYRIRNSTSGEYYCGDDPRAIWYLGPLIPPDSTIEHLLFAFPAVLWLLAVVLSSLSIPLSKRPRLLNAISAFLVKMPSFSTYLPSFLLRIPLLGRILGWFLSLEFKETVIDMAKNPFVKALDVWPNASGLIDSRDSRLATLDIFRIIAMIWVMCNHLGSEGRVDILERLPSAEKFKTAVHSHDLIGPFLGNSALGVEIFLVLGGILGVGAFKQLHDGLGRNWAVYIVKRSLRLWLTSVAFIFIAASPQLRHFIPRFYGTMVTACGWRGLAAHLTFTANLREVPTCLGYLWYLGLDFQLHLVVLPLLVTALLHRDNWNWYGRVALIALPIVSILFRAHHCWSHSTCNKSDVDIPFIHIASLSEAEMEGMYFGLWKKYARPMTKLGPFVLAVWIGVKEKNKDNNITLRTSRRLFWGGLVGAITVVYLITFEYWWPDMDTNLYNLSYTALFRTAFSLCLLAMICSFILLENPPHYCWLPFFTGLAKVCFSAYLVHMPLAYTFNYVGWYQETESAFDLVTVALPRHFFMTFGTAIVFYLLVEAPMANLATLFIKRYTNKLFIVVDPLAAATQEVVNTLCKIAPQFKSCAIHFFLFSYLVIDSLLSLVVAPFMYAMRALERS